MLILEKMEIDFRSLDILVHIVSNPTCTEINTKQEQEGEKEKEIVDSFLFNH